MKIEKVEFVLSAHHDEQLLGDGRPQIAFVGRSNVGKSSLMNRLLGRRGLARTSSTPGRTQAVNYFLVDDKLYFVDLPGYGFAKAPVEARRKWGELVDRYLQRGGDQRLLLVQLIDAKVGATRLDVQAIQYLRGLGFEPLIVATKSDKVSKGRRRSVRASICRSLELPESRLVLFSAVSGEGVKQLWKEIMAFLDDNHEKPRTGTT